MWPQVFCLLDCIASHSHSEHWAQGSQDVIHWIQTVEVYTFHAVAASRVSYMFSETSWSRYRISICIKHASTRRRLDPGEFRRLTESNFYGVEVIIWPVTPPSDLTSIFFDAVTEFQCSFISSFNQYQKIKTRYMTNSRQCSGITVLSTCPSGDAPYYTVVTLLRLNLGISIERWMILTTPPCISITIPEVHV